MKESRNVERIVVQIIKIDIAYTIFLKILLGILKFGEGNGVLLLFMSS
jgi:hypothetical protein